MEDEVAVGLVPAVERDMYGHPYEATCELCYFLGAGCENLESCLKLCGYGTDGYFKKE